MAKNTAIYREALRLVGREQALADLRDGRRNRVNRIDSAKRYQRRPKHKNNTED